MRKGYITVYFSLVFVLCVSLLIGLMYGARENAIRAKAKEAMDISVKSVFGEYQRNIWDRYHMLFVDTTYGYDTEPLVLSEEHLIRCLNENFDEERFSLLEGKDLLKLYCNNAETDEVRFVSDDNGYSIRSQARRVMGYKYGIEYIEKLYKEAAEADERLSRGDLSDSFERAKDEVEKESDPTLQDWTGAADAAIFSESEPSRLTTINLLLKDSSGVSKMCLSEENLFKNRELNEGNYDTGPEETITDILMFKEYVLDYFGNYSEKKDETVLEYEAEYCIAGNVSDAENLESVLNRILLVREGANAIVLASDETKMNLIEGISEVATALIACPELEPALAALIFLLWCFAESVSEVRVLLKGGKIPTVKKPEDWRTDFSYILSMREEASLEGEGMSYKDYLRVFLYLEDKDKLTLRVCDLMEANVRKDVSDSSFRLDNCIDAWKVTAYISSEYGYDYLATRNFNIENY